jgi:hypothetical protein
MLPFGVMMNKCNANIVQTCYLCWIKQLNESRDIPRWIPGKVEEQEQPPRD